MANYSESKKRLVNSILNYFHEEKDLTKLKFSYDDLIFIVEQAMNNHGRKYVQERSTDRQGGNRCKKFINMCFYHMLTNRDIMILLQAAKGAGKSSAALVLAKLYCRVYTEFVRENINADFELRFDPKRHIAYTVQDMMHKIDVLEPWEPLIADEALNFILAEEWAKSENKELRKKLGVIRTKHLFFIMCFPMELDKIQKTFLNSYINFVIFLYTRGKGVAFRRNEVMVGDPWNLQDFKRMGKIDEFSSMVEVEKKFEKHSNFETILNIPKPSDSLYKRYLAVREANVYRKKQHAGEYTKKDLITASLMFVLQDFLKRKKMYDVKMIEKAIRTKLGLSLKVQDIQDLINENNRIINDVQKKGEM